MKQACMYCGEDAGEVDGSPDDPDAISHGLCVDCLPVLLAGLGKRLTDFLDAITKPVFVVDADSRVIGANTLGLGQVSKNLKDIEGRLGGDVFECRHAGEPGGCGKTIHCKACTIRRTVTHTAETGESAFRVPAYMDLGDLSNNRTVRYLISTEKVDEVVLLRIDDAEACDAAE
jgi:hypothetical protein